MNLAGILLGIMSLSGKAASDPRICSVGGLLFRG